MREHVSLGMKPPAVHGRAQVQLFDDRTGREVYRNAQDNFVSERWLRAMAWFANWGAFANNSKDSGKSTAINGATAFRMLPFTGIALTDYAGAPDQNERLIRGAPLAHGSKGIAGDGNGRGSYNSTESVHLFAYHKLVFDFATNQANGSFQSIYTGFMDSAGDTAARSITLPFPLTFNTRSPNTTILRDDSTGILYECAPSRVAEVTDWTPTVWALAPTVEPKATLSPPAVHRRAFAIRGGRLYWLVAPTSAIRSIVSAPLSDLTNHRTERVLDTAWAESHGAAPGFWAIDVYGFAYYPAGDVFLISVSQARGPKFTIMSLDPITFADVDKWGTEGAYWAHSLATYPGETSILIEPTGSPGVSAGPYATELLPDGTLRFSARSITLTEPLGRSDLAYVSSSGSTPQYQVGIGQHFFSRALLDEPVTKTNANTMKITYEFTFDKPELI